MSAKAKVNATTKDLQCDVCKKSFKHVSALNIHKRVHNGDRPHKCDFCGKGFTQTGSLTVHRRLHNEERPYGCDVCQRTFRNSSALVRHKRTHTGEKAHECDVCLKKFSDKGGLKVHKRIHTNEMPYQCEICQRRFRQGGRLKYHKQTHGKEVYSCETCEKVFDNSHSLRRHELHYEKMPYKCDVCKCKSYVELAQLERHRKSHSHLCNIYNMQAMNKNEREIPNVVLKKRGEKLLRYVACNSKSCGEAVLHYHKTSLDNNHENGEQPDSANSAHSERIITKTNVENEGSSQMLLI